MLRPVKSCFVPFPCGRQRGQIIERNLRSHQEPVLSPLVLEGRATTLAVCRAPAGFPSARQFASYTHMVESRRESNGKSNGTGNARCGNKYQTAKSTRRSLAAPLEARATHRLTPRITLSRDAIFPRNSNETGACHRTRRKRVRFAAGFCQREPSPEEFEKAKREIGPHHSDDGSSFVSKGCRGIPISH